MFPKYHPDDATITNNDNIQSCETQKKQNYSIPTTSTPNHHSQCIATTSMSMFNLHKSAILPPVGKDYMCFKNYDKTAQADRCIKSRIITKVIDSILSIDTFEQLCVVLKGVLQSLSLKDHVKTIGIDQSLSNNDLYEHKFLQNINNLYKHSGKCDGQQQFKDILGAAMVYTPEVFTNKSPISPMTSTQVKKPSARKSLCIFTNILDVKDKTAFRRVGADKSTESSFIFHI